MTPDAATTSSLGIEPASANGLATTVQPARALFITMGPPYPPYSGGHQRTDLLLRALASRYEVDTLVLGKERNVDPEARAYLASISSRVVYRRPVNFTHFYPWCLLRPFMGRYARSIAYRVGSPLNWLKVDKGIRSLIAALHTERGYDVTLSRYLFKTYRCGVTGVPGPRHLLDDDDVELTMQASKLQQMERVLGATPASGKRKLQEFRVRLQRRNLRHVERALPGLYREFAHVFVCSEADVDVLRGVLERPMASEGFAQGGRAEPGISVLPNIPWTAPGHSIEPLPERAESASLLVVGTWGWTPNIEGLDRFLTHAWPLIRQARPDATLRVVGSALAGDHKTRLSAIPGVEPVGFVNTLDDAYGPAALVVAPVYTGAGTKLKVVEAAAYGRVCVCTDHSYRGYEQIFGEGEHVMVGRDDQTLARHCIALLNDPARRARMSAAAAQRAAAKLSWPAFSRIVAEGSIAAQRAEVGASLTAISASGRSKPSAQRSPA